MYLTPLVNKVIQPAKPVANFEAKPDGFTVRFQNLSNVAQGTWDFGDGTPLQPVGSQNEFITHKFPAQGDYTVKLSVHNILNEENDRTVVVKLGDAAAASTKPTIIELKAIPMSAGNMAPATFRLASQVENAAAMRLGTGRGPDQGRTRYGAEARPDGGLQESRPLHESTWWRSTGLFTKIRRWWSRSPRRRWAWPRPS